MVRSEDCAEPSFAARREARRFGIAMAAIMPMIATTMSSSISEKPFWFFFMSLFAPSEIEISWLFGLFAPPALSREQPQRAICRGHLHQGPCQTALTSAVSENHRESCGLLANRDFSS